MDEHHHNHHKHLPQGSAPTLPRLGHPVPQEKDKRVPPRTIVPSLEASESKTIWAGEAPTAPLTPFSNTSGSGNGTSLDDVSGNVRGSGSGDVAVIDHGIGSEIGSGVSEEGEKPRRPKSMVAKLRNVHKRRSSLPHSRSGSFAGGLLEGRVSRTNLYPLPGNANATASGPGRSPTNAEAGSGADGDGDDNVSEDGDGDASSDEGMVMGAFEGLKWGEMVQFKMPAEGEVRACRFKTQV